MEFGLTLRRVILLGTPLALTVWMLFHPSPYDDYLGELVPIAGWWITLHTVQFVLFALMGAAVWMLTDGLQGSAATVSRLAAVVFTIFYAAFDAIAGISTGILARAAGEGALGDQAAVAAIETLFHHPVKNLLGDIGVYAWIVALVAAAVALYQAGALRAPLILLVLPAIFLNFDHAFPFGSLTFGSFFLVALWLELSRREPAAGRQGRSPSVSSPGTGASTNR